MYYIKDTNMSESYDPNIVDELARQIAEDMVPICNTTCESRPDAIVETLLSRETVRPILDKLRAGRGSRVNFKSTWNPILLAKITAAKSIPTDKYVEFLKSNEMFVNVLKDFTCISHCDVDKLTNNISNLVLEPYRANIIEMFESKGKSAGGRKQKSRRGHKHRGHKQKSRRGHKHRGHNTRRGHKTRRHRHRRSTRKH
jgi:hypothetical protein